MVYIILTSRHKIKLLISRLSGTFDSVRSIVAFSGQIFLYSYATKSCLYTVKNWGWEHIFCPSVNTDCTINQAVKCNMNKPINIFQNIICTICKCGKHMILADTAKPYVYQCAYTIMYIYSLGYSIYAHPVWVHFAIMTF